MIYTFKCRATGDRIMLGPDGDQLLRLLGREPAARGILEVAALPAAIASLQRAVEQPSPGQPDAAEGEPEAVGLRQRLWPMIEMMRTALAAGEPVVWGV